MAACSASVRLVLTDWTDAMHEAAAVSAGPVGVEHAAAPSLACEVVLDARSVVPSPEVEAALSAVLGAGQSARQSLDQVISVLSGVYATTDHSTTSQGILDQLMASDIRELRRRSNSLGIEFAHAMMVLRAACIRELVDKRNMSLSQVGRELSISRQMVTRLYGVLQPAVSEPVRYTESV